MNHAWTVNLARHVEPRKTTSGKTVAWMAIAFIAALGLGLWLFAPK